MHAVDYDFYVFSWHKMYGLSSIRNIRSSMLYFPLEGDGTTIQDVNLTESTRHAGAP
ncbi:MAG: hypothetical protein ACSLEL_05075 [Candidatus Malihini olakiniferum]